MVEGSRDDLRPRTIEALHVVAQGQLRHGQFEEAEKLLKEGLQIARRTLSDEHRTTLLLLGDQAQLAQGKGEIAEALEIYTGVLEVQRRTLSGGHPDTVHTLLSLAGLRLSQDQNELAETVAQEAYDASSEGHGEEDEMTIASVCELAEAKIRQGLYSQAESILQRSYRIAVAAHGKADATTMNCARKLGKLYAVQRKGDVAERYFREVLEQCRKTFGDSSAETLSAIEDLAGLLEGVFRFAEAQELATELLDRRGSLDDQRRLANLYRKRRIASRAIELSAAAWASSIKIHGRENEITLGLMRDSAEAYDLLPDPARVRSILDEGLELATRELGAQNVLTRRFKSARNSAFKGFAASQLRERQAKFDYQHAVETHGPAAEATLKAWDNWIIQLTSIGEIEASRKQVESYVERCQSPLGPGHATSLRARHTQAWHAQHSGEDERAEKLFRLLIEAEQSLLPPGHALTMVTLRTFSDFLLRRDRQADALAIIDSWQDKLAGSEWPPDSFDVLVPRASRWRFLNQSTDEGTAWKEG